jgi:hypothetical protein
VQIAKASRMGTNGSVWIKEVLSVTWDFRRIFLFPVHISALNKYFTSVHFVFSERKIKYVLFSFLKAKSLQTMASLTIGINCRGNCPNVTQTGTGHALNQNRKVFR